MPVASLAPRPAARARTIGLAALVVATAAFAFANSVFGVWVFDDLINIRENQLLRQFVPTAQLWAPPQSGLDGRPLPAFTFALNYAISGLEPWSYHVLNIALHGAASLALFGCVRTALGLPSLRERWGSRADVLAAAVALLWSVHPLHTSAVTYVSQRGELLVGLIVFGATWCALRSFTEPSALRWQAGAVTLGLLGGLTKESVVVLPVVVLLLDAALASGSIRAALRARRGFYAALALVWVAVGYWLVSGGTFRASVSGDVRAAGLDTWTNLQLQAWAITHYLGLVFWPHPLVLDYGWPLPKGPADWMPHGCLVVGLLVLAAVAFARGRALGALGLLFFVTLAPSSSFIMIPAEPLGEWRMYQPLACVILLLALGAARALERLRAEWRAPAGAALTAAILVPLCWTTIERNRDFHDDLAFWRREALVTPHNHRTWYNLAESLRARGALREALTAHDRAAELLPDNAGYYKNRALVAAELGDLDTAVRHYRSALELEPNSVLALDNLGKLLLLRGDAPGAELHFRRALAFDAEDATAHCGLGRAFVAQGQTREGVLELRRALQLAPRMLPAIESLVLLLSTSSDPSLRNEPEALALVEGARRAGGGEGLSLERLMAVTLAAAGRTSEAIEIAARALEQARARGAKRLAETLQRELDAYRAGTPLRDLQP